MANITSLTFDTIEPDSFITVYTDTQYMWIFKGDKASMAVIEDKWNKSRKRPNSLWKPLETILGKGVKLLNIHFSSIESREGGRFKPLS